MRSKTRYRLEYWIARAFAFLTRLLPLPVARFLGALVGQLAFSVLRIRRGVTLENLGHAFAASRGQRELTRIGARCYRNLGLGTVEFCRFPTLTRRNLGRLLEIEGLEHCRQALARRRGVIILSGHFGAWEFLGPAFALNGYPVDLFTRSQRNPLFDELISDNRGEVGARIQSTSRTPRGVIRSLRQNRLVVMLADQDAGRDGVFVSFLGRLASTPRGVARFAIETDAAVLMSFVVRERGGRHRLIIHSPMEIPHTGDRDRDLLQILQTYTACLETYVRAHPEQWFWPHRRWKTRPPTEGLSLNC